MKLPRRTFLSSGSGRCCACLFCDTRGRTVKIIVPLAPRGSGQCTGSAARGSDWGHAGCHGGCGEQARRWYGDWNCRGGAPAPDGNTLLVTNPGILINAHLRKQDYDPLTSFEPVCKLVSLPTVLAVNSESPYRTLTDLINAARSKPGALTLATFTASGSHIAFESLKHKANVDITFVPYPGSAPAVTALLGGACDGDDGQLFHDGRTRECRQARALATTARHRVEGLNIPTVAEAGIDMDYEGWFGLFAQPMYQRKQCRKLPAGQRRRCMLRPFGKNSNLSGFCRRRSVARISPYYFASHMRNSAVQFAKQISKRSEVPITSRSANGWCPSVWAT